VGNFILNTCRNFFDDDVIIVTSSVHRTQPTLVIYHNLQVTNNTEMKKNE